MDDLPDSKGIQLERDYVRKTYDKIANDFSDSRYKKWPRVDAFLRELPTGSLLLDVGCGNGKYLDNSSSYNIGCDLSLNLLKICKNRGFEVVLCDMSALPFRQNMFDTVICVAALHHVISSKRRRSCLRDMSDLMTLESSKLLAQVWSFEQELNSDNPYLKRSSRGGPNKIEDRVEIDPDLRLPIHQNRTPFMSQDVLVPFHTKSRPTDAKNPDNESGSRQLRYYHVFKEGELNAILQTIPHLTIEQSYYDKGNWCVIASKSEAASSCKG